MKEIDKKLIETISRYAASGIDQQVANLEKDRISYEELRHYKRH